METQHTISEMTVNNQMSDVQFLFGKYEELQHNLTAKEKECDLLNNKLDVARENVAKQREITHRFCDALSIIKKYAMTMTETKATKKDIIRDLEDITMAIAIFGNHWRNNDPDLDFAAIMNHLAERRFENDSTNS